MKMKILLIGVLILSAARLSAQITTAFNYQGQLDNGGVAASALVAPSASSGGFSLNVATGQNASGAIQTAGDLPDANWTVTNSDNYKNAPIAYTVAPGDADWYGYWQANGPASSWIAADPNTNVNGNVTYTLTFDLSGYNPAYATLAGGKFMVDDACTVSLNGHVLGSEGFNGWQNGFAALSTGAGDFLAGVNTLVIQTTGSDHNDEAARLEGLIVDTVLASTPIRWASAVSGNFATASEWSGGVVPGAANDALLEPRGAAFTVTASASRSVNSVQTAANATLDITGGTFTAALGTGGGSNGGAIVVGDGAGFAFGGTLANIGSIALEGAGRATTLSVGGSGGALIGAGSITLSDNARNLIVAGAPGAALTNIDNTIAGAGQIGGGLALANGASGVIDASGQTGLVIALGSNPMENAGLMEATGAGGLILRGSTIDSSNGGIIAAGNASHVALQGADLIGGTLRSTGSGLIWTYLGANQLDGRACAVTNQARLILHNSTALTLQGAIVNSNQIGLDGFGGDTRVVVGAAGATLSGGGQVILNNHADNIVTGSSGAATLTNVDNTLTGAGQLGLGSLTLINEAKGLIVGSHAIALTIDTGAGAIVNAGRIVADGAGGVIIKSAVENGGLLEVETGVMTVEGAVSGAGAGVISAGTLDFTSSFTQKVVFRGASGVLDLAQSQAYTGTVVGFSTTGGTALDLGDIGFVGSTEATFAGTASGGTLTVTDGTHTAHIALAGDYTASTFTASSDGHGGTLVVDPTAALPTATAHRFVAAAAGLGAQAGGAHLSAMHDLQRAPPPMLGRPAVMIA